MCGLFGVFAPRLDLKALIELRDGESPFRIEMPLGQRQADHQRAAGGSRYVQRGQRKIVVRGDR